MKWYISFDILAAANGIVKEHLPPFFVNQGPLNIDRFYLESMQKLWNEKKRSSSTPNSKVVICSWELSSKFKSLSK